MLLFKIHDTHRTLEFSIPLRYLYLYLVICMEMERHQLDNQTLSILYLMTLGCFREDCPPEVSQTGDLPGG